MNRNPNIHAVALDKLREAKRLVDPDNLPHRNLIATQNRCGRAWVLLAEALPELESEQPAGIPTVRCSCPEWGGYDARCPYHGEKRLTQQR